MRRTKIEHYENFQVEVAKRPERNATDQVTYINKSSFWMAKRQNNKHIQITGTKGITKINARRTTTGTRATHQKIETGTTEQTTNDQCRENETKD